MELAASMKNNAEKLEACLKKALRSKVLYQ